MKDVQDRSVRFSLDHFFLASKTSKTCVGALGMHLFASLALVGGVVVVAILLKKCSITFKHQRCFLSRTKTRLFPSPKSLFKSF